MLVKGGRLLALNESDWTNDLMSLKKKSISSGILLNSNDSLIISPMISTVDLYSSLKTILTKRPIRNLKSD
jgi:hypothetical protein